MSASSDHDLPNVRLDSICKIVQGGRHKLSGKHFIDEGGYPAYGAGGHNGNLPSYEFDEPAIVLSAIGARCGKCFQPTGKWSSLANTSVLFPDTARADIRFLWYQLNDEASWHRSGTAQPYIKPSDIKGRTVHLPPLEEQKRIAAILDAADALRAKRRESIAQLDALLQSTFLHMFGDPVTNPMGWSQATLDELGVIQTGSTPPSKLEGMFGGDIPFVTPSDLKDTWIEPSRTVTEAGARKSRTVLKGATLVCCIGTIGKMGKASAEISAFNQQINAVSWGERIVPSFGLELLRFFKAKIENDGASTTLPILKKSRFQKIAVPVPPVETQLRFSDIVDSVEQQKALHQDHLAELDALFASLQHRAFNGELLAA